MLNNEFRLVKQLLFAPHIANPYEYDYDILYMVSCNIRIMNGHLDEENQIFQILASLTKNEIMKIQVNRTGTFWKYGRGNANMLKYLHHFYEAKAIIQIYKWTII